MTSPISSAPISRTLSIESINQYGRDRQRNFEACFSSPLNCKNLLDRLSLTTSNPLKTLPILLDQLLPLIRTTTSPSNTIHQHVIEAFSLPTLLNESISAIQLDIKHCQQMNTPIDLNHLISILTSLQQSELSLPQLAQGTRAILSYVKDKANKLIPIIMSKIKSINEENPDLLLSYQKILTELLPYLFQNEYSAEITEQTQAYITHLASCPKTTKIQQDTLSDAIANINKINQTYMDIHQSKTFTFSLMPQMLETAFSIRESVALKLDEQDIIALKTQSLIINSEPFFNKLEQDLIGNDLRIHTYTKQLQLHLIQNQNLLIDYDECMPISSGHKEIIENLNFQMKILKFLFSIYNADVAMKKILILNTSNALESSINILKSFPHAPLTTETNTMIDELLNTTKQQITKANELLDIPVPTEAINLWLIDLDRVISSIQTSETTPKELQTLVQRLQTIISQLTKETDIDQASVILQQLHEYIESIDSKLNWSEDDHMQYLHAQYLKDKIKAPLKKLLQP